MNDLIQYLVFTNTQYIQDRNNQIKIFGDGVIPGNMIDDILKLCHRSGLQYGINLTGNYILIF